MKSKLCSGLVVLSIAALSATAAHADEPGAVGMEETASETGEPAVPAHASDDGLRLVDREVRVVNKGKANNADDVFWFRLQVRDLCVAVGSGVGDSEPGPCSDWRFLKDEATIAPKLRLSDGMSAGAWSAVEVYAQLLLEAGAEASKLQLELVDGLWVAHLDSEQRAAVGRFPDAALSVSEVRWGAPAVPGSGPALVVPGLDIGGARQLVLGAFDRDPGHRASTVPRHWKKLDVTRHRYDWRSSFHFEIKRQGRDWAKVTGIMSGVFGGVALAGVIPSAGQGCGGGDICPGLYVTMGHMIALGSANQLSGSVAASLGGIHWLVANTADPEVLIAKLRRRRIATGIAALSVGIAAVVSVPALDYAWFGSGLAGGGALGLVAFSLLAVSSAHFRFEADFKRMITAGYVGSQHKPTHPKVALVPTIAPRPGGVSLGLTGVF